VGFEFPPNLEAAKKNSVITLEKDYKQKYGVLILSPETILDF
jgi:hypothetical protein